jgi:O-antigen/teichoic acid export membrane protein
MLNKVFAAVKNKHFLSLSGNVIMSGLGMVTMAILYRALSIDKIGVWVFFFATFTLVDTFRSGFITTAFIKFYAGSTAERSAEVAGSTWYIALCITVGLVLLNLPVLLFVDKIDNEGLQLFFKWFGLTFIFTLPSFIATCIIQGEQRFDRLLYVRAVNQGLFILFILTLIITGKMTLITLVYAYLLANFFTSLFTMIKGWSGLSMLTKRTRACTKELFDFGKYSVGTTLSANLFRTSDTFIINFLLGPAALAIYNLGQSLMQLVEIPLRSFAATGMPSLSAAYNQNKRDEVIYVMKKYVGMLTVVLIPAALVAVLFADVAIALIGGGKYAHTEAANVFRLFMTFALLYPADRFFALTLDVIHQPKINFYKVLVMLAANVIFDLLGIYIFKNIYGVALATVVPTLIAVAVGYWALNKYQKFGFLSVYAMGYAETKLLVQQLKQKIRPGV